MIWLNHTKNMRQGGFLTSSVCIRAIRLHQSTENETSKHRHVANHLWNRNQIPMRSHFGKFWDLPTEDYPNIQAELIVIKDINM